jgi:PTH1 family peptidyl-tRNA hydrolase
VLGKPLTFMNASGPAVLGLLQFFKIELQHLLVIVDDVNLEAGRLRARGAGSAGGHNGLKSIIGALGSDAFARLRVGVGGGDPRRDLSGHVLGRFAPEERPIIAEAVARSADAAELFVAEGMAPVMNRFNRREDREEKEGQAGRDEESGKEQAQKEDRD